MNIEIHSNHLVPNDVNQKFDLHELELRKIIDKKFKVLTAKASVAKNYWNATSYSLDQSTLYNELKAEQKNSVLIGLTNERINEALFIEKWGMTFTAKMSLSADSLTEKLIYSGFSEDEARHYLYFESFQNKGLIVQENPFLTLLKDTIQTGERRPLIFIIQILLEGWGLSHYSTLRKDCNDEVLKSLLTKVLADESNHHAGGLTLFNQNQVSVSEKNYIVDTLKVFLLMIQMGEQTILKTVEQEVGGLTHSQKLLFLKEIESQKNAQEKLMILKKIFLKTNTHSLLHELDQLGYFSAFSEEKSLGIIC